MKTDKQTKWTALYERLSRDDDTFGEAGKVGTVIVKDMSRVGRDHL